VQVRLALALFLSFLVLAFSRGCPGPEASTEDEVPGVTTLADAGAGGAGGAETVDAPSPVAEVEPWNETIRFGRYHATFDNAGAHLLELRVDGFYQELFLDDAEKADPVNWVRLLEAVDPGPGRATLGSLALGTEPSSERWFAVDPATANWAVDLAHDDQERVTAVTFTLDGGRGVVLEKTLRPAAEGYDIEVDLVLHNTGAADFANQEGQWLLTPAMGVPRAATDNFYVEPKAGICWRKGKDDYGLKREERHYSEREAEDFPPDAGETVWGGVDNKYFLVALRPADHEATAALHGANWRTVWDAAWAREHEEDAQGDSYRHIVTDLTLVLRMPSVGESMRYPFRLYAGPKDKAVLESHADGDALAKVVKKDLGFFSGIAGMLTAILSFFHGIAGNWGVAIVLLTLFVRLALFPFNRRSQTAMARHATKMKRIQPRLNELKEKHAKDPRKQREEQARIMQEEGAFPPLGGCLPIFVQIPVFFGLFSALRTNFDLRHARFTGWINDLSEPDRFMRLGWNVPLLDMEYLNVLPPLMVVLWIVQQRVMPKPTDEQALRMQKMMMWMPILFGFFLYNYAAGLSLYMITTSAFGILEQTVIKKIWPIDDAEQPKKKGGFMDRLAKMQEQAKALEEMKRHSKAQQHQQRQRREKSKAGPGKGKRRR